MKNNHTIRIIAVLAIYLILRYAVGPYGQMILYPVSLFVTFLHEAGHAFGAILTGGDVVAMQISHDGSGFTKTMGGSRSIILMGGYLGSALFGNLLFYIGARKTHWAPAALTVVGALMIFVSIFWFNSMQSTIYMSLFALALFFIATKTNLGEDALMFLGLASIIYIIQDFNVGPTSDLKKYAEIFMVIPASWWMYIWLTLAVLLSYFNLKLIFRTDEARY